MCGFCTGAKISRREFCGGALAMRFATSRAPTRHAHTIEPSLRFTSATPRSIAVTLDACPGKFDMRIASTLVARNIPATIFVTALWMQWNRPALAYLLARPDIFTLQNHGAKHLPAVLGSTPVYGMAPAGTIASIKTEIFGGATAIAQANGKWPRWYRGAGGLYSPEAIPIIESYGFSIAGYSLNADEGASLPANIVAARILAAQHGDIIEGHINQPHRPSGAGIAAGLIALQESGARFVRLDEVTSQLTI